MIQAFLFSKVTQIVPVPRYYRGTFTATVIATALFEKNYRSTATALLFQSTAFNTDLNINVRPANNLILCVVENGLPPKKVMKVE
ncbi:hypothetical protein DAPPUDRAFT_330977 [Daphnia pulex]|uniref:Uncharacterized protein n=1 Tax=Daphnia pulex TaxID=6669 RepID=E9HL52_DAPPU|nr:hypothetical protein DAPPUDRAFT_330977 [Daphnia pulex]|eukprot:EFX67548.1 hypothetical protein DAPPUDRAFT_330977 [Daphnia pulex]